jgi:hypothetical protein
MVALARYVGLEPLHAHTNCGPIEALDRWCSDKEADSMLVAKKTYRGKPIGINAHTYKCVPPDQERLRAGLMPRSVK